MDLKNYVKELCVWFIHSRLVKSVPDKMFLKIRYRLSNQWKKLNLKTPNTFNEKLQWIKLYDRKPEYAYMVDKYEAKKFVADKIGEEHIIPTLGVWDIVEDIDFDKLPDKFVLKCTHDSGGVVFCTDKKKSEFLSKKGTKIDMNSMRRILSKSQKKNYYYNGREWAYKNVKPRIIAEQYIEEERGCELRDYRIFTFGGKAKLIVVDIDPQTNYRRNIYSTDWEFQDFIIRYPNDRNCSIEKPKHLNQMLNMAEKLACGTHHLRVDFYCIKEKIYFGELTFYHASGTQKITPESYNYLLGSWITLPC